MPVWEKNNEIEEGGVLHCTKHIQSLIDNWQPAATKTFRAASKLSFAEASYRIMDSTEISIALELLWRLSDPQWKSWFYIPFITTINILVSSTLYYHPHHHHPHHQHHQTCNSCWSVTLPRRVIVSHSAHPFATSLPHTGTFILNCYISKYITYYIILYYIILYCFDQPDDNCDHHNVMTGWAAVTTL